MNAKNLRILPILGLASGLAACSPDVPAGVNQNGGDAPLVVDLDATDPLVVGTESLVQLRGVSRGSGEQGGFTGTFTGVGGPMCVILDPENVWDGTYGDDGDVDLYLGRAADYTGQPGVAIGDFVGEWIDDLGVSHPLDQNLCIQTDYFGRTGASAGQGEPEYCTINTDLGTPYTVLGLTWSAPLDDDVISVAVRVDNGACAPVSESTLDGDN